MDPTANKWKIFYIVRKKGAFVQGYKETDNVYKDFSNKWCVQQ